MASTYLTRTLGSSSNSGTISMWVKRSKLATTQYLYANLVSGTNYGIMVKQILHQESGNRKLIHQLLMELMVSF
jgi:hypothetical protein